MHKLQDDHSKLLATRTTILSGSDPEAKRREILNYFHDTFDLYERLFESLNCDEAYYDKAIGLRHPLIFYYGHTAVFYVNKLHVAKLIEERLDPRLESTVAIGVDEMSWDDLNDDNYEWPTVAEVKAYRDRVRELVDGFIRSCDVSLPIGWDSPLWIVMMGIEHERIHLETSSVLMRQLPVDYVDEDSFWRKCPESGAAPKNELLPVTGGVIQQGKEVADDVYGWDNEYGSLETEVEGFNASKYLVSNGEFLRFVEAGGYETERYWTDEGWSWVQYRQRPYPEFWVPAGDSYNYRTMASVIEMPWNWPVDVNYLEAKAFCNWLAETTGKSLRLPTEAEWLALRNRLNVDQPDWEKAPGNVNLEHWATACPVDHFEQVDGFYDVIGNVWQWTETPIDAFPGFKVHPAYDDFSTPTFDTKHNLIKGGSYFSTGNSALKDSRYAFRRHFFQHAGFRYVETDAPVKIVDNNYETDDAVAQYVEFHYGRDCFGVPNFPQQCARICRELLGEGTHGRMLELGCAVGRAAFEMAPYFEHVDALDFSARFVQVAAKLQRDGRQRYTFPIEGELVDFHEVDLEQMGLSEASDRIRFMQSDACNLATKFNDYDLILAANLIDRLYDPKKFLESIHERLRPGGLLVLTSPYTWLEEHTDRDKWLGGFKVNGENYTTLDALHDVLGRHFVPVGEPRDVPFVIRETARKHQHTIAELTAWRRQETES